MSLSFIAISSKEEEGKREEGGRPDLLVPLLYLFLTFHFIGRCLDSHGGGGRGEGLGSGNIHPHLLVHQRPDNMGKGGKKERGMVISSFCIDPRT